MGAKEVNGEAGGGKGLQRQMTRKAGTVLAENVAGSKAKTGRSMAHLVRRCASFCLLNGAKFLQIKSESIKEGRKRVCA